jgi:tetraacyldisaccharide-1-P 4'-kinase
VWLLTATGNPAAVEASATESGCTVVGRTLARDHHWFGESEIRHALAEAQRERAQLLVTAKDAVRWPAGAPREALVLRVAWEWRAGGEAIERRVLGGEA